MQHDFTPIEEHGLIGDLQTSALVTTDGTIDWFCTPRVDSPSVFASLLDRHRGGFFRIAPENGDYVTKQLYLPGTAILITRFISEHGVGEVVDFMPVTSHTVTDRHRIVRLIRVVRGEMKFVAECQPRFDYGRQPHKTEITEHGVMFAGDDGTRIALHVAHRSTPTGHEPVVPVHYDEGIRAEALMANGEMSGIILETAPDGGPRELRPAEIAEMFEQTREYWRGWLSKSTYRGRWREQVERSAMTLKLMTYRPTGGLVAAPTTGLPEQPGGERNWDYRYTWVRDGSFSVYALLSLGFTEAANSFVQWLCDRIVEAAESTKGSASPLNIMYRVDGSTDLEETSLEHFEGWCNSTPVRIGNGAGGQLQLDIYGEAMDSLLLADRNGLQLTHQQWTRIAKVMDWLCENWDQPDDGIWETRGGRQDFTYGRVMCWVALDRAIRIANHRARPADLAKWTATRDAIYKQVMEKGWNAERGAFVQHYNTTVLDASLLYMPLIGFISPQDPMWLSTLDEMDKELVSDSLVYRYNPEASPDGLRGSEGTFSMCTFWYVDALARSGRLNEARLTFEKMLTYANHLGLYSEEIGPTGEQIGNFPQAFSHLALISAAVNLDYQLDHGAGSVGVVTTSAD